jgi:hypothetical protein
MNRMAHTPVSRAASVLTALCALGAGVGDLMGHELEKDRK